MKLTIGTQNDAKYQSIVNLVRTVLDKRVISYQKTGKEVIPPNETGKTSKENCKIKAKYYRKYISSPFIVADDAIYLPKSLADISPHLFHGMGKKDDLPLQVLFQELYERISNPEGYPLTIKRYFGCIYENSELYFTNIFKGKLFPMDSNKYLALLDSEISQNPLNYFLCTTTGELLSSDTAIYSNNTRKMISKFINSLEN